LEVALYINTLNTTLYPSPEPNKSICFTVKISLTELNGIRHPFKVKYTIKHEYREKNPEHMHLCPQ